MLYTRNKGKSERNFKILEQGGGGVGLHSHCSLRSLESSRAAQRQDRYTCAGPMRISMWSSLRRTAANTSRAAPPSPSLLVALRGSGGVGSGAAGPDLRAKAAGGGSHGAATGPLARATPAGAPVAWRRWLLRGGRACERRRRAGAATTVGGGVDLKKGGGSGGDRRLR